MSNNVTPLHSAPVSASQRSQRDDAASTLTYLFVDPTVSLAGCVQQADFERFTERHKVSIEEPELRPCNDLLAELADADVRGVIFTVATGSPTGAQLKAARNVISSGRSAYFYWTYEHAVEVITPESYKGYWNVWFLSALYWCARAIADAVPDKIPVLKQLWRGARHVCRIGKDLLRSGLRRIPIVKRMHRAVFNPNYVEIDAKLPTVESVLDNASPFPLPNYQPGNAWGQCVQGPGVYLRTDFWNKIKSGGSYGHTCYVAKELSDLTQPFVAFMPYRYDLLDDLGIVQHVMPAPAKDSSESTLVKASEYYFDRLKSTLANIRPSYVYERLVLGNYTGAALSQLLEVPYIVEYNGSEIAMRRSFDGQGYEREEHYLKAEAAAFAQATIISVVSDVVKEDLVARGVSPDKILVNPNGADPTVFAPPAPATRDRLRKKFGWTPEHCVIGFTGTFGKWHGIEVLAEAIPRICEQAPNARFLLIGDGACKSMVDDAVRRHGLKDRVRAIGRVPQSEGARLLGACDVFLSPHHRHMVNSRFFGSPTKLFEYMAMGGAIVASDLEQIGEVLSPALRPEDLNDNELTIADQRAVLCAPGDVEQLVRTVIQLTHRSDLCQALGVNARAALINHYSWKRHVDRLWAYSNRDLSDVNGQSKQPLLMADAHVKRILTADAYKDEVQNQWNQDPCGSQYAQSTEPKSLEWFLEVERHRYGQYGPWMPRLMEFAKHAGEKVLEIGAGLGTDLAQFAKGGAHVTDIDLSAGHLEMAKANFKQRNLQCEFVHHDAETLPFESNTFDVVYSNGVIHHTPNTDLVVNEIHRVLKPGGKAIIMVYAEHSYHYWYKLVLELGLRNKMLADWSVGEIMSRHVELSSTGARPLVKVYTRRKLQQLFAGFSSQRAYKRQLMREELPNWWRWLPIGLTQRLVGWNLVIKAVKGTD